MKRSTKNIINSVIIVLLIISLGVTIYFKSQNTSTAFMEISDKENFKDNFISGASQDGDSSFNPFENSDDSTTPPEIPSGETTDGETAPFVVPNDDYTNDTNLSPSAPNGNETDSTTPPEIPSGDASQDGTTPPSQPSSDSTDDGTIKHKQPSGDDSNLVRPSGDTEGYDTFILDDSFQVNESDNTVFNVLIVVESIGLSLSVVYLFVSKYNKLTFKEVFTNRDNLIVFLLVSLLLAIALSWGLITLSSSLVSNNVPDIKNINKDFSSQI